MRSRIIDENRETGRLSIFHQDDAAGKIIIENRYDVEPMLEQAHDEAGQYSDYRPYAKGDWHKVAVIPKHMLLKLSQDGVLQDRKALMRWLNEHSKFKVGPGNPLG